MLECDICKRIDDDLFWVAEAISHYESGSMYRAFSKVRDELNVQWDTHQEYDHDSVRTVR